MDAPALRYCWLRWRASEAAALHSHTCPLSNPQPPPPPPAGDLNAPLLSVIRSGFLHAQPSTAAAHRPLQMRVTHRLAVFDCREAADDGSPHLVGVFSQSDAVRWVQVHACGLACLLLGLVQKQPTQC